MLGLGAGVNGALTGDERRVVGAAQQLGLIPSSDWPDVAAHLLAQGADGEAVSELAGLPRTASAWSVDRLVPQILAELAIPQLSAIQAGDLVAQVIGQVVGTRSGTDEFAAIRSLARLAPDLGCPRSVICDAYHASEWLDCECHTNSPERDAAIALEDRLRAGDPLDIDPALLRAVTATWI